MKYVSTRAEAPVLGFEDALLAGLASDGGLYVPEFWPELSETEIRAFQGAPYTDVAHAVMAPFVGDEIPSGEFFDTIGEACASFRHPAVAPLVQVGPNTWILELFHGPTLSFKDVAMQILSRLMDRALAARKRRITIVGATSGDTGGAAIEAFRGREAIDVFILHPHGRVSNVQRRQMTTAGDANIHNIAVEGTFDDCQAFVKALFNDPARREALSLGGVNSINWARIMAQIVYYFTAATALGAPGRSVSFSVPTGNFGDIFAGYVARKMGLPVGDLLIATNANDILARTVSSGRYEPLSVKSTSSPSMDIQVSSNFERLIFELTGRDGARIRGLMGSLVQQGHFELDGNSLSSLQAGFSARRVDEEEVGKVMNRLLQNANYLADPHTSVALAAAEKLRSPNPAPMVVLATAHPAKFPDAVEAFVGRRPPVPDQLSESLAAKEHFDVLANDYATIADYIAERSRVLKVGV